MLFGIAVAGLVAATVTGEPRLWIMAACSAAVGVIGSAAVFVAIRGMPGRRGR